MNGCTLNTHFNFDASKSFVLFDEFTVKKKTQNIISQSQEVFDCFKAVTKSLFEKLLVIYRALSTILIL